MHRVGRTGRAGQAGTAITLFADKDEPLRKELAQELGHDSASASEGAHAVPTNANPAIFIIQGHLVLDELPEIGGR